MSDRVQMCGMAPHSRQQERDREFMAGVSTEDLMSELRRRGVQFATASPCPAAVIGQGEFIEMEAE